MFRLVVGRLVRVRVRGESMTPTLRPDDHVIVWRSRRRPPVGAVIVYRDSFTERLRVKRVSAHDDDGRIRVVGDNPLLSTSEADLGVVAPDTVLGPVILHQMSGPGCLRLGYALRR